MSRATEDTLGALHGALAQQFLNRIQSGEASPADLNAARQFLKDNSITCDVASNQGMQELEASLPTQEELDRETLGIRQ